MKKMGVQRTRCTLAFEPESDEGNEESVEPSWSSEHKYEQRSRPPEARQEPPHGRASGVERALEPMLGVGDGVPHVLLGGGGGAAR